MMWNFCCCRRNRENNRSQEMTNSNAASDESQNTQISVISANGTKENVEIPTTHRTRTYTESSVSSMKSIKSFYSVNSGTSKEGDFYSVCSEESYKST